MSENETSAWNAVNGGAPAGSNCAQETADGAKVGVALGSAVVGTITGWAGYVIGRDSGITEALSKTQRKNK